MQPSAFIEKVIEVLNQENESCIGSDEHLLDVSFMVAAITQHIGEPQYATFLSEVDEDAYWQYNKQDADDYWSYGYLYIPTKDGCNGVYYLTFGIDERMWGYCMCTPAMQGYSEKHRCCGNGCDWRAPAFYVEKRVTVGIGKWSGVERDYWAYSEKMVNHISAMNADVAEEKRRRKEAYLREQIAKLQAELAEVE